MFYVLYSLFLIAIIKDLLHDYIYVKIIRTRSSKQNEYILTTGNSGDRSNPNYRYNSESSRSSVSQSFSDISN